MNFLELKLESDVFKNMKCETCENVPGSNMFSNWEACE